MGIWLKTPLAALLASVATAALAQPTGPGRDEGSAPVMAGPQSTTAPPAAAAPGVASTVSPQGSALGEVVVTARKRTENVQAIPETVQVVGQTQLQRSGLANLPDLPAVAPGVNIAQSPDPDQFAVTIRGLGSEPGNPSFDSSVSLFVDGVFTPRGRDFQDALFDVSNIEIIRGTNSALLGKNTSLGALDLVTNKPGHDFGLNLRAQHEFEYDSSLVEGAVDLPVNDKLAFRVSGKYDKEGGFVHNIIDNTDGLEVESRAGRIVGVWNPTSSVDVTGLFQAESRISANSNLVFSSVNGALPNTLAALSGHPVAIQPTPDNSQSADYSSTLGGAGRQKETSTRAAATVNWHLNGFTLTSQTGYDRSNVNANGNVSYLPTNYALQYMVDRYHQFTEELRLASPTGGRLEYIVGAFYLDGRYVNSTTQNLNYPFGPAPGLPDVAGDEDTLFDQKDKAYSAFGQANLELYGPFKMVAGLRYTNETKSVDLARIDEQPGLYSLFIEPPHTPFGQAETENDVDGSVGFNYQVSLDSLLYTSWGQGTKAAAFANSVTDLTKSYIAPEVARTTEIGSKNQFLNRTLTVNGAVFYTRVDDYQLNEFNGVSFTVSNTDLQSFGFESELDWAPVRNVRLFWNNTYADSSDLRVGGDIPFAPRFSGAGGFSLSHDVLNTKRVSLDATVTYRSSETSQQQENLTPRLADSTRLNLSAGFGDPTQGWELRAIANNLNNEHVIGFNFPGTLLPAGNVVGVPDPPRMVYLQLTYRH